MLKRRFVGMSLAYLWALASADVRAVQDRPGQTRPAPAPLGQSLVISNARIIDGKGGVLQRGAVVIRDGRIVSVSAATPSVPGARVMDAHGMTVMPGFIDAHRHLIRGNPTEWLNEQAPARMQEFLDAGFTTVQSAGDAPQQILELRRRLQQGTVKGPRLLAAGRIALARAGGGAGGGAPAGDPARFDRSRPPLRPTEAAGAIPAAETRAAVEATAKAGFDVIKTAIIVTPGGPEKETLALIVKEGKKYGLPTLTHAVSVEDTLAAVEAGVTTLAHTPHIGQLTRDQARTIANAAIPMISTLGIFVPVFSKDNVPLFRDALPFPFETLSSAGQGPVNARLLWEAGITYGYGTDTSFLPKETLATELRPLSLVFSPKDIIAILTRNAAIAIGRSGELGTLEPGKLADLVIIDGDPVADISDVLKVAVVIKSGEIVVDSRVKRRGGL
jgi:imidazolonepropionase-like amidohydrolase